MKFRFPATVAKIEDVPEQFRPLYAQTEGSDAFNLVDDPKVKSAIEAVSGAFRALDAERAAHKATQGTIPDLTPLADFGSSPQEIRDNIAAKLEEAAKASKSGKGPNIEDALAQAKGEWTKAHVGELKQRDEKVTGLQGQLQTLLVDQAIDQAVAKINPTEAGARYFKMLLKEQVRPKLTDNNQLDVTIVDSAGTQRFSGSDARPDGAMTIQELAAEAAADAANKPYIKSEAPSGGGTPPGSTQGTGGRPAQGAAKSAAAKIAAGLKNVQRA